MDDYYLVLGIEPDARPEAIQERFRFLAQAFHPDKYSSPKQKQLAEEEFKKINNAYQILSNPRKRADYDFHRNKPANYSKTNTNDVNKKAEEAARQRAQEEQRKRAEEAERQRAQEEQRKRAKETAHQPAQEEFNKLIHTRPINLRGLDLKGFDLKGLDLSQADLSEANLYEAYLAEADLSGANLSKANLGGADLSGAVYNKKTIWPDGFDLKKAGAILKISVSDQELERILQSRTKSLRGLYLRNASLHGADLSQGNLSRAFLCGADLSNGNLSHADLWDANLRDANLRGADLSGTNLGAANLRGAVFDKNTKWPAGFDPIAAGAILFQ